MTDQEKIIEWNKDNAYRDGSVFVDKLGQKGLTLSQIVSVLETIDDVCNHCWDAPTGCQCWNDE